MPRGEKLKGKHDVKDYSDLINDKCVKNWIDNIQDETRKRTSLAIMKKYVDFTGLNPTELIDEHFQDTRKREKATEIQNLARKRIMDFYEFMKKKVSDSSAYTYTFSILPSFYRDNNIPVELKTKRGQRPDAKNGKGYFKGNGEDKKYIKFENRKDLLKDIRERLPLVRDKAYMTAMASSGFNDVDMRALTIGMFKTAYMIGKSVNLAFFPKSRVKSGMGRYTCFNGEACDLIHIYLDGRKAKGKEIITDNSYCFASEYLTEDKKSKPMTTNAFSGSLKKICKALNITGLTPKGLRDYFDSVVLIAPNIPSELKEFMMGHAGNVSKEYAHITTEPEAFVDWYSKNIDKITSLGNGQKIIGQFSEQITDLEKRVENLRVINEKAQANGIKKDEEIEKFKNRLDSIEEMLIDHELLKIEVDEETYKKAKKMASEQNVSIIDLIKKLMK